MSIFKNNKEEENRVAASEPHVEQESEVLSAEDVRHWHRFMTMWFLL